MSANVTAEMNTLIKSSRLLDDNLMTLVFDGNIEATQLVLNIILGRKDLVVTKAEVQKVEKSPLVNGRDVVIDIFSEDAEGNHHDIEIQRASEGAAPERARFLSAVLDQRMLKERQEFKEIKGSYVIFITEKDTFKRGRPLSHIERTVLEDGVLFEDGNHIIYANGAYHNNDTAIGRLMHDFRCTNPENMYCEPLKKGIRHFKETEGGRTKMSSAIEKYGDSREAEGIAKGVAIGETKGEAKGEIKGMDRFGKLIYYLLQSGRNDDIVRATQDTSYRDQLLKEMEN